MQIIKLKNDKKKYMAIFSDGQKVKFGASGYSDFILSGGDIKKREAYRARHAKDLDTGDPRKPGFLSYYLLWNKPTLEESIKDYERRFKKYL
jgi:hypothetical protein